MLGKNPALPSFTVVPYHQAPPDLEGLAVIIMFSGKAAERDEDLELKGKTEHTQILGPLAFVSV